MGQLISAFRTKRISRRCHSFPSVGNMQSQLRSASARIPGARKGRSDRSTSDQRLPVLQHNGGNKRLSDPPDATEDDSDFAEAPARGGEEIEMRCGQPRPEARNWTVIRKLDTCQRNPYHSGQHRSRDREWEQGRLTSHLRIRRAAGKGRK